MRQSIVIPGMLMAAVSLLSACQQPKTFASTNTDTFTSATSETYAQANQIKRADYLFTIDYSYSMHNKLAQLRGAMSNFANDLQSNGAGIDYRIGVVRGNIHGTASTSAEIVNWTPFNFIASFLTPGMESTLESSILDQISDVGDPLAQNSSVLLEATRRTLAAQSSSFLRADAQLVVVFISDGDDVSNRSNYKAAYGVPATTTDYANRLKALKPSPNYLTSIAIVAGGAGCALDTSNNDIEGTRLAEVAQLANGSPTNDPAHPLQVRQCIYNDFDVNLSSVARDATRLTSRFPLQAKPFTSTLRVRVNGAVQTEGAQWNYVAASNEIVFVPGQEPAPSAQVSFDYDIVYALSRSPKVDTITVTVDGNSVPQDAVNGWSYVAAENRIAFNGSAKPANGAAVRVSYQTR